MTAMIMMMLFIFYPLAISAGEKTDSTVKEREAAQAIVEKAKITFNELMRDANYGYLRERLDSARGVVIFPQVLKGGFIVGGSGGTGVFMVRDKKTGEWSEPAFYTLGSVSLGFQAGAESAEVIMLAMTDKALDSLLSPSFKLGGDVSVAVGPVGGGAKANMDIPAVTADFISFAKSKGLYAGVNLEGSVIEARDGLNKSYFGKEVRPADIVTNKVTHNSHSAALRQSLKCKC
jgi:lipid-binding SYLF domain-containing protein